MQYRAILYIIGMLGFSLLTLCSSPETEYENQAESTRPSQESWNSEIYLTQLGMRNAVVRAGHLEQYNDRQLTIMNENVEADFFKDNEHTSTLWADSAVVFQEKNIMRAFRNVVVKSDSGVTLFTERLAYDPQTEKITSDTTVKMTTETDTLHGVGFESNTDLTEWKILEPWGVTRRKMKR
ncbi:MAG: Lipopolysaccharide export system protein LptC [Candidatus Marinimicrobia bacterium]|nr:Lipopolysaccharide export system protein LptC [Candidatus Neomarinimicrobiota bacterium]